MIRPRTTRGSTTTSLPSRSWNPWERPLEIPWTDIWITRLAGEVPWVFGYQGAFEALIRTSSLKCPIPSGPWRGSGPS